MHQAKPHLQASSPSVCQVWTFASCHRSQWPGKTSGIAGPTHTTSPQTLWHQRTNTRPAMCSFLASKALPQHTQDVTHALRTHNAHDATPLRTRGWTRTEPSHTARPCERIYQQRSPCCTQHSWRVSMHDGKPLRKAHTPQRGPETELRRAPQFMVVAHTRRP